MLSFPIKCINFRSPDQYGFQSLPFSAAHSFVAEGGGAAVLGSIQPQPLPFATDGTLDLDEVEDNIKPDDPHYARTRLLCLENTQGGKVIPLSYLADACALAEHHGLGIHLDGARIFNASVKLGVNVREISTYFDTLSVCLSKGLCAPVGSVLCGRQDLIRSARRWRKMLGGGMRQAGVLAAAGIIALTEQVALLARDHANAAALAERLADTPGLTVDPDSVQTNMIFAEFGDVSRTELFREMHERGVLLQGYGNSLRLVTHFDFHEEMIDAVVEAFRNARTLRA